VSVSSGTGLPGLSPVIGSRSALAIAAHPSAAPNFKLLATLLLEVNNGRVAVVERFFVIKVSYEGIIPGGVIEIR